MGSAAGSAVNQGRPPTQAQALIRAMRPNQWVKNLVVFAGAVFSGLAVVRPKLFEALVAAGTFCLISSATYLFNDLRDRESDRLHPTKRNRPIASGALHTTTAMVASGVLLVAGLGLGLAVSWRFFQVLIVYGATNIAYSLGLKRIVILDVMLVALGFVLRAVAGAVAVGVDASSWIVVCSLELAMLIVLGKRRADFVAAERSGSRSSLPEEWYSVALLDQLMTASAGASIVTYAMYTLAPETVARVGSRQMVLTLPMVIYGCLRYLFLAQSDRATDDPALLLVSDRGMQICGVVWLIVVMYALYR
jgi:4-hydroxybenzoate polyprenyltransferase